nr:G-type lectin S-receptor-like serine/threonine-protein kinase At4g27290 [Tanacetum cinerariifolium]
MNPKISDFGLARKFVGQDTNAMTKKVVGTYGYISPEYAVHGRFSIKSDVFSFGVLVLEIVSGKKNREFFHENHGDNLLGHAWRLYKDDRSIELISESLRDSCVISEVVRSIHVGLLCVQHLAKDRPTMLSVLLMLASDSVLPPPKQPAFFTGDINQQLSSNSSANEYSITQLYPSFGVLVLEIVSGKKNRELFHENHGDNLLGHAWRLYKDDRPRNHFVDQYENKWKKKMK